jgi:myo-inositol catabolism protein IolC
VQTKSNQFKRDLLERQQVGIFSTLGGNTLTELLFARAAECWMTGVLDDESAIAETASRFHTLVSAWQTAVESRPS